MRAPDSDMIMNGETKVSVKERPSARRRALCTLRKVIDPLRSHEPTLQAERLVNQAASKLLSLPLELREQIWSLVFAERQDAQPAHLHIYDTIYDSCTYEPRDVVGEEARRAGTQTALLRTCRSAHDEAVRYLYEDARFDLIVFAGKARPVSIRATAKKLRLAKRLTRLSGRSHQSQRRQTSVSPLAQSPRSQLPWKAARL
jgi:hypothetical protein